VNARKQDLSMRAPVQSVRMQTKFWRQKVNVQDLLRLAPSLSHCREGGRRVTMP
jgi:hypothetical protein